MSYVAFARERQRWKCGAVVVLLSYAAWVECEATIQLYTVMKRVGGKVELKINGRAKIELEEAEKEEIVSYSDGLRVTFNIEQETKCLKDVDPLGEILSTLMTPEGIYSTEGVVYSNGVLHTVRNYNNNMGNSFTFFSYSFFGAFPRTPYGRVNYITQEFRNYNAGRKRETLKVPYQKKAKIKYILTSFASDTFDFFYSVDLSATINPASIHPPSFDPSTIEQSSWISLLLKQEVTIESDLNSLNNTSPFIVFRSDGKLFWVPIFGNMSPSLQNGFDYIIYGQIYQNGFYHVLTNQKRTNNGHDRNFLEFFFVFKDHAYKKGKTPRLISKRPN